MLLGFVASYLSTPFYPPPPLPTAPPQGDLGAACPTSPCLLYWPISLPSFRPRYHTPYHILPIIPCPPSLPHPFLCSSPLLAVTFPPKCSLTAGTPGSCYCDVLCFSVYFRLFLNNGNRSKLITSSVALIMGFSQE